MSRLKVVGLGLVLLAGCDSDPQLQALNDELQTIRQQALPMADEVHVARPGTSPPVVLPASLELRRTSTAPGSFSKGLPWISSRWSAPCRWARRRLPCYAARRVFIAWRWGITWGLIMGASWRSMRGSWSWSSFSPTVRAPGLSVRALWY